MYADGVLCMLSRSFELNNVKGSESVTARFDVQVSCVQVSSCEACFKYVVGGSLECCYERKEWIEGRSLLTKKEAKSFW